MGTLNSFDNKQMKIGYWI